MLFYVPLLLFAGATCDEYHKKTIGGRIGISRPHLVVVKSDAILAGHWPKCGL
jgi:hypothetical protein